MLVIAKRTFLCLCLSVICAKPTKCIPIEIHCYCIACNKTYTFAQWIHSFANMYVDANFDFVQKNHILPDEGDNIIRTLDTKFSDEDISLGQLFFDKMKQFGRNVAQIDAVTGESDTYGELLQKSIRIAMEMKSRGIKPDDIIGYCTYNERISIAAYIAAYFVGAVATSIHPLLPQEDMKNLLAQVSPTVIFSLPTSKNQLENIIKDLNLKCEVISVEITGDVNSFSTFLKPKEGEDYFRPYIVEDVTKTAAIFFSSGTTGSPKGICLSHKLIINKVIVTGIMGYDTSCVLTFATLYWISTLNLLAAAIYAGNVRLLCNKFHPVEAMELIDRYKVTFLFCPPVHAKAYINTLKPGSIHLPYLKYVCVGGSYASNVLFQQLQAILTNAKLCAAFAMTEVAGMVLCFNLSSERDMTLIRTKPSSCGRPVPGNWYKIVDTATGKALGPNQSGELRIKTKYQLNGYYNRDSSSAWDEDHWFKTGDIFYYDEDYCFHYVDRSKDMIKYHLWQISTGLLVEILEQHPAVKQAVVLGVQHEADGEHALGVVVLKENCLATPDELRAFVDSKVDDTKKLRGGVKIVDMIPMTPTGKIKKTELKKMLNL